MGNAQADYVEFNAKREFGRNQYTSRYILGDMSAPALGNGLRFINDDTKNYDGWLIHQDDIERFSTRYFMYLTLRALGKYQEAEKLEALIKEHGELKISDPSHYDYLTYFYSEVCKNLGVEDRYQGSFSSNGDKMYQYRDRWEEAGVPWFHGTVCYMLMNSVYRHEVRDTRAGWVDPAQWVIDNYKTGHNLFRGMIENNI